MTAPAQPAPGQAGLLERLLAAVRIEFRADIVAGLINHQYGMVVLQVLHRVAAYVVADPVRVPCGPREKVLHAVGVTSPARSAMVQQFLRGRSESSPEHQLTDPTAGFDSGEPARDLAHQALERLLPAGRVYAVTCGHRVICFFTPVINGGRTRQEGRIFMAVPK
jgi:hypothetical protein